MKGEPTPSIGTDAGGQRAPPAAGVAANGEAVAAHLPRFVRRHPFAGSILLPVLRPGAACRRLLVPLFIVLNGFVLVMQLIIVAAPPEIIVSAVWLVLALAVGPMAASWQRYCALDDGADDIAIRVDRPSVIFFGGLCLLVGLGFLGGAVSQALGLFGPVAALLVLGYATLVVLGVALLGFALPALVLRVPGSLRCGLRTPWRVRALAIVHVAIIVGSLLLFVQALGWTEQQPDGLAKLPIMVALVVVFLAVLVIPINGYFMLAFLRHRPALAARHAGELRPGLRREDGKVLLAAQPDRAVTLLVALAVLTVWFGVILFAIVPALWQTSAFWDYLDGLSASILGVTLPVGYGARALAVALGVVLLGVILQHVAVLALQVIDGDRFECDDEHFSWIGASISYVVPLSAIEAVELRRMAGQRMLAIRLRSIEPAAIEGMIVKTDEDTLPRRFFMALYRISLWILLRTRTVLRLRRDRLQIFRGEVLDLDSSDDAQMLAKVCELNEALAGAHLFLPSSYALVTTREFARELRDRAARASGVGPARARSSPAVSRR